MMNEEILLKALGYVMASPYRLKIIKYIGEGVKIPSDIAKYMNISTNHVSNILHDLKSSDMVVCINEDAHKGRLYKNTELSLEILEYVVNNMES